MKSSTAAAMGSQNKGANGSDPLGSNSEIGRKLRQYYDDLVSEDVPDRFADLLRKLEDSEKTSPTVSEGE